MAEALTIIEPPEEEPVSLAEAKLHLRVTHTAEDALIASLVEAARQQVESDTQRALVTQTLKLSLDRFPRGGEVEGLAIVLPCAPVQTVDEVRWFDGTEWQVLDEDLYTVIGGDQSGRLLPVDGYSWPGTPAQSGCIEITFTAGYGEATDVPARLKQAVLMQVQLLYERGDGGAPGVLDQVQKAYDRLVNAARNARYV